VAYSHNPKLFAVKTVGVTVERHRWPRASFGTALRRVRRDEIAEAFEVSFKISSPDHRLARRRGVLAALCGAALFALSAPTAARQPYPGILGGDDRVRVEAQGPPWNAIGQVNVGGYRRVGKCTGTLVAPNVVVTAAHCVVDPLRGAPFPLHDIHFLAAVRGGKYSGHSTARCLHFSAGYALAPPRTPATKPVERVTFEDLATDVVEVVLRDELDVDPMPVADAVDDHPGLSLIHAAYPADKRMVLSAHFGCQLLRADLAVPLWLNDCDTHPASSGGPVLAEVNGALQLVAIMVAAGNGSPNVAVPISRLKQAILNRSCP
jgi:protease YdgD